MTAQSHDPKAFNLPPLLPETTRFATAWLLLALGALVVGGLFTLLIVLSRTPGVQDFIPWVDFFHTALVVHVDLTVLVWFLAFAGVLWSLNGTGYCASCSWVAFWLAVLGTLVFSVSPFLGAAAPLMNNYVPVLRHPLFFTGLGLFGVGFTLLVIEGLLHGHRLSSAGAGEGALRFGLWTGLVTALASVLALVVSYLGIPVTVTGEHYYELLFWGVGHTLQFTHTQLMLVVWLWLAAVSNAHTPLSPRVAWVLLALGAAPVLLVPLIYMLYEVSSGYHLLTFTWLMQYGGGLAALPIGLAVVIGLLRAAPTDPERLGERNALWFSIILFAAGGIIGFLISGSSVTIPAHYHGSIVAVTLAYMGISYHLLPQLGFRKPRGRLVEWQPIIYGTGQLLHVLGLAWSGGHGVQRKTAGSAQGLEGLQEILGMALMGLGGLIAIIGGVLFLVICYQAMSSRDRDS